MASRRASATLAALATIALAGGAAPASAAGFFYCCVDAAGKQVCGDTLPQACYGRAYRELGDGGRTLRVIEAPLTPEQRAARTAEVARQKAEEDAHREQQRKDQALMNTYGSEQDIDLMRQRAEADIDKSIKAAEAKIAEIKLQRKKFENEAEFYKKKPLPNDVRRGMTDADYEIKAQELLIEAKKKDREAVRAKYDEDKRRYVELSKARVVR
jgi:hypothetical protein